jgi:hypothetical protein
MLKDDMIERQLERYRRLLYGANDPLLVEGLRKIIRDLEAKRAATASRSPDETVLAADSGDQPDLFLNSATR